MPTNLMLDFSTREVTVDNTIITLQIWYDSLAELL